MVIYPPIMLKFSLWVDFGHPRVMWDPYNLILLGFGVKKFGSRKSGKNPIFEFPALIVPPLLHPATRNSRHVILWSWAIKWTYYHIFLRFVTVKIFWPSLKITLNHSIHACTALQLIWRLTTRNSLFAPDEPTTGTVPGPF